MCLVMAKARLIHKIFDTYLYGTTLTIANLMEIVFADGGIRAKRVKLVRCFALCQHILAFIHTLECIPTETKKYLSPFGDLLNCNCVSGYSGLMCDQSKCIVE